MGLKTLKGLLFSFIHQKLYNDNYLFLFFIIFLYFFRLMYFFLIFKNFKLPTLITIERPKLVVLFEQFLISSKLISPY